MELVLWLLDAGFGILSSGLLWTYILLALDFEFLTLGVWFWALDFGLEILHLEFWTSVLHFGR